MTKIIKNGIITILLLFSISSGALLTYLHFAALNKENLSGTWTARLDMTEQAAVTAYGWLQDIEGVTISLEDMRDYMQGLSVEVHLTLEQTVRPNGNFKCSVSPESYDACIQAAYESFAEAFEALVAERLHMAGYTGNTEKEAIKALVSQSFGMSTESYLTTCAPSLLPSLEELQAQYDGSGTYKAADGILIRQFEDGLSVSTRTENYIREGTSLILSEATDSNPDAVIYTLEQPSSQ